MNLIPRVLAMILIILCIEFMIKLKKSEGKLMDEVRKPLMIRIVIITILGAVIHIINIIDVILNEANMQF